MAALVRLMHSRRYATPCVRMDIPLLSRFVNRDKVVQSKCTNALSSSVKIISEAFYEIVRVYEKNRRLIITNSIEN